MPRKGAVHWRVWLWEPELGWAAVLVLKAAAAASVTGGHPRGVHDWRVMGTGA